MFTNNNGDLSGVKIFLWVIAFIVGVTALGLVGHLFNTAANIADTPATLIDRAMRPENIENSYHLFRDEKLAYNSRLEQIKTSRQDLTDSQTDKDEKYRVRTELRGQEQSCRDIAAQYNADSLKADKRIFKDPIFLNNNMPQTLDMEACGAN